MNKQQLERQIAEVCICPGMSNINCPCQLYRSQLLDLVLRNVTPITNKREWEEDFKKKFLQYEADDINDTIIDAVNYRKIIDFISKVEKEAYQRAIEEVRELYKISGFSIYDEAIKNVITKLQALKEEIK